MSTDPDGTPATLTWESTGTSEPGDQQAESHRRQSPGTRAYYEVGPAYVPPGPDGQRWSLRLVEAADGVVLAETDLGVHPDEDTAKQHAEQHERAGSFRFDWQASDRRSFLHWLLPTVIPASQQPDLVERLSQATNKFTDVELTILINGIPVDAQAFLDGVEHNMDHFARVNARRLLTEVGGNDEFERLETLLREATHDARLAVERRLTDAGYELPNLDD